MCPAHLDLTTAIFLAVVIIVAPVFIAIYWSNR